jgi:hypothetical protein
VTASRPRSIAIFQTGWTAPSPQSRGKKPANIIAKLGKTAGLVSDKLYMLALRGLEEPCGWTRSETWAAMSVEAD